MTFSIKRFFSALFNYFNKNFLSYVKYNIFPPFPPVAEFYKTLFLFAKGFNECSSSSIDISSKFLMV